MTMKFIENFDFASEFQVISLFLCVNDVAVNALGRARAKEGERKRDGTKPKEEKRRKTN